MVEPEPGYVKSPQAPQSHLATVPTALHRCEDAAARVIATEQLTEVRRQHRMWPDLERNGGTGLDGISDSRSKLDRKTDVVAPVVAAERVFDELPGDR